MSSDPVPLAAIYDASADGRSLVSAANFAAMRALLDLSTFYASIGHNHSGVYSPVGHTHAQSDITNLATDLAGKQATLVSGTNLKTINSTSLLGSGDIAVSASPAGSSGQVQYNNAGAFGGMTAVVYAGTGTHVAITSQAAATIPLCIKGAASQSGNLTEWQSSAGTVGARVTSGRQFSNSQGFTAAEAFGDGAVITGSACLVTMSGAGVVHNSADAATLVGSFANAFSSVSYGAIAIGISAQVRGLYSIAIGAGSTTFGNDYAIVIGQGATPAFAVGYGIAIGAGAAYTAANQFVSGANSFPINSVYFGKGVTSATPTTYTIHGTGGSGTNIAGANVGVAGGKGTGTGTPGCVVIQTAIAGSSGATLQTLSDACKFDGNTTAGETRMLLLDIDAGTLKRVSIGSADSGGTGFKVLRVPN